MKMYEGLVKAGAALATVITLGGCAAQSQFEAAPDPKNPNITLIKNAAGKVTAKIICLEEEDGTNGIGNIVDEPAMFDFRSAADIEKAGLPNPCRKDGMIEPAEHSDIIALAEGIGWTS
jgi:hypothetical protein